MKNILYCFSVILLCLMVTKLSAQHNYAELLQKSIYFYDVQRSGVMPAYGYAPGQNRVRWIGNQHTYDGYDLVLPGGSMINGLGETITDANKAGALQGGFRDSGDNPKWSQSITFAINGLAWSGIEYRNAMISTGQMPYLLENVKWGTDYILRCFLATNPDDITTYKIVMTISDFKSEQGTINSSPNRPHWYVDKDAPQTPNVANFASCLALASVLFRQNGDVAYADKLFAASKRLYIFCQTYWGYGFVKNANGTLKQKNNVWTQKYFDDFAPGFSSNNLPKQFNNSYANWITPSTIPSSAYNDYVLPEPPTARSETFQHSSQLPNVSAGNYDYDGANSLAMHIRNVSDNLGFASIWLNRAEVAKNGNTAAAAVYLADAVGYANLMTTNNWIGSQPFPGGSSGLPLHNISILGYPLAIAIMLDRLIPSEPKYRLWVEQTLDSHINAGTTSGGLSLNTSTWGPFERISHMTFTHLLYADQVKDPVKKNKYENFGLKQIQYILGANPENRCYITGYKPAGVISTNIGLHMHAIGNQGGFDDFNSSKPTFPSGLPNNPFSGVVQARNGYGENRNMMYGALIGGPSINGNGDAPPDRFADRNGVPITTISTEAQRSEVSTFYQPFWTGAIARMVTKLGNAAGTALPINFAKESLPDGEDIPNPIPPNSKWMREEFFSDAKIDAAPTATTTTVRIRANNKSRWPQRIISDVSVRYYFTLEPTVNVSEINLLNPFFNPTCPPDADGATLSSTIEGDITKPSPTHGTLGSDVVVVSTDGSGNRLCYVEIYFKKPSVTTYNYLFDNPVSTPSGIFAARVAKDPLAAAIKLMTEPLWTPVAGPIPADGRNDFEVIMIGGVYRSKNIGWQANYSSRQAVLRLTFSAANNTANDWSYANLAASAANPAPAMNIPLYNNGQLLSGDIPTTPGQVPGLPAPLPDPTHDYKKAIQQALYYFETQRSGLVNNGISLPSGTLMPNRVEWRGNAHHVSNTLGGDNFSGANLVGGLYAAGDDYLKSSWTMSSAASLMAWSALEFPNAYTDHKNNLLGTLKYISDYFLQSIVYGNVADVSTYKIHLMVTDRMAATTTPDNFLLRHQKWAAAEVMHEFANTDTEKPIRRYFYADKDAPSVTMVSGMAAALAATSKVFRLEGGTANIAYADQLLVASRRLYNFVLHYTHGAGKMLNYTGQNFTTRTIGVLAGYATATGFDINGVMENEAGVLVRHDPFIYPASTTIFNAIGTRPAGISGSGGVLGGGNSPAVRRMDFGNPQPVGTGADYDAPIPDYHKMPDDFTTNAAEVSIRLHDDLCWAAIWLNQAETDAAAATSRLNEAISFYAVFRPQIGVIGSSPGNSSGFHWFRLPSAILLHKLNAQLPNTVMEPYRTRIEMSTGASATASATNTWVQIASANAGLINTTNNRMQRPGGSSAPNMYSCMALLAYANAMNTETPAISGLRLDLQNKIIEVAKRNLDAMLGTNASNRSYMIGYDSRTIPGLSGVAGLDNNHSRTALGYFAGIGHRTTGINSLYTIKSKHIQYGGIVSGPQGNYNLPYNRENSLSQAGLSWSAEHNETALITNAFAMFGLGYLNRDGSGTLLADFPMHVVKDDEVFVEAGIVSNTAALTRVRATLNNRSLWPAKAYNNLRFRYYFTLETGASVTSQTITAHDASTAPTISAPVLVSGNQYYVEVAFSDKLFPGGEDGISGRSNALTPLATLPNQPMHFRRSVEFQLNHNAAFVDTDDWSFVGLPIISGIIQPSKSRRLPVYDGATKIFGNQPGGFDFELWVDENNDGIINGGDTRVNGNVVPVNFGTTPSNVPVIRNFIARNSTFNDINLNSLWQVPQGFSRTTETPVMVPANNGTASFQLRFDANGYCAQTGQILFVSNAPNPLENPFRFNLLGNVNYAGISIADNTLPLNNNDIVSLGTIPQQQGTPATLAKSLVISNHGCNNLSLSNFTLPTGYTFSTALPATLAPGATSTLGLVFSPTCTAGTNTGNLSITTNDPLQNLLNIVLTSTVTGFNANAGNDQSVLTGTTVGLQATTLPVSPTFTGAWTIGGGRTGTFSDPSDPASTFTPTSGAGNYPLIWTVTGSNCTTVDGVNINIVTTLNATFGLVSAIVRNCNVNISFDYLNQPNNSSLVVEHSTNGTDWKDIATLSKSDNIGSRRFTYLHTTPAIEANYYRIKQIAANGGYSYSKMVLATNKCENQSGITTYPNPVQETLTVMLPDNNEQSLIQITDGIGKLVISTSTQKSVTTIDTQSLAMGLYHLMVITNDKIVYRTKFVKQ